MTRLVNRRPGHPGRVVLAALPFVAALIAYAIASDLRLAENPGDKLLPSFASILDGFSRLALEADKRTGSILLWEDTLASLGRLAGGMAVATALGLAGGIGIGLVPYVRATFASFLAVLSMVPPLAVLPILFIVFGLGEVSKVMLIVFGVAPFLMRDMALRVGELPAEQIIKAQTLGASTWQIVLRVVLPQMWPRLIDALRLSLGAAWLFLIAAEAIAAQSGLGYRIFLLRRYMAMDVILPYVAWITLLAFTFDWLLRRLQARAFPWFAGEGRG